jgi:hypothetical protein
VPAWALGNDPWSGRQTWWQTGHLRGLWQPCKTWEPMEHSSWSWSCCLQHHLLLLINDLGDILRHPQEYTEHQPWIKKRIFNQCTFLSAMLNKKHLFKKQLQYLD